MPAIGLGTFAETLLVQFAIVDEVILSGNIKDLGRLRALITWAAVSNSAAFEFWVISPVWIMKSGAFIQAGTTLTCRSLW
jgi:hypothetical protein